MTEHENVHPLLQFARDTLKNSEKEAGRQLPNPREHLKYLEGIREQEDSIANRRTRLLIEIL